MTSILVEEKKIKIKSKYLKVLQKYFGFSEFRSKQFDIINNIIKKKKDVCAIMPTGIGKSLCYQYPAVYLKKVVIVVCPLISLMEDQKLLLQKIGISVCCLNSTENNSHNVINEIVEGEYLIVYMTPEYAIKADYLFNTLIENKLLGLVAIDEGHCVSLWGQSFRQSYTELYKIKQWIGKYNIPMLVLTATATHNVINDITNILKLDDPVVITSSFDRPNLYLEIKLKQTKSDKILEPLLLDENKNPIDETVIIYCLTRAETEKTALLVRKMGIPCEAYHAGIDAKKKNEIHHMFVNNEIKCIAATIAFGMGINKSNVRKIIHMNASKDIESYYQEIGRAGRDGLPSHCYAFYTWKDFMTHKHFLEDITDQKFKNHREKMIRKMENLVQSSECRRKTILEYFDEKYDIKNCGNCDNCTIKIDIKNNVDFTSQAKSLLGIVHDTGGRFGLNTLILMLRGSKNKKIPAKYYNSKYYNTASNYSENILKILGKQMIKDGYLQEIKTDFGYRVCRTKLGECFSELEDSELNKIIVNII
jgi:Werner syndrome ATP-dependent helicase